MKVILGNGKRRNLKLEITEIPTVDPVDICSNFRSAEFNSSTDWVKISADFYTYIFEHGLETLNIIVNVWEEDEGVYPHSTRKIDENNIEIKVSATPDRRFSGKIVVAGCL